MTTDTAAATPEDPLRVATAQTPTSDDVAPPPMGFPTAPGIRRATIDDIRSALSAGVADFKAAPQFGLFFGAVFAAGGLLMLATLSIWTVLPLAIAFPLLCPFLAAGLYEVSRRRSAGEPLAWGPVLSVVWRQKDRQLGWMAFVMLFVFWVWAYQVRLLFALFLGFSTSADPANLLDTLLGTENGLAFLGVGTVIGAIIALTLFSVTVLSMPLLVDRDVDMVTAMVTSVAAVRRSPVPMLGWGVVVTLAMIAAMLPAFLGLLVVLPVLGHATWRLYERLVVWPSADGPSPSP